MGTQSYRLGTSGHRLRESPWEPSLIGRGSSGVHFRDSPGPFRESLRERTLIGWEPSPRLGFKNFKKGTGRGWRPAPERSPLSSIALYSRHAPKRGAPHLVKQIRLLTGHPVAEFYFTTCPRPQMNFPRLTTPLPINLAKRASLVLAAASCIPMCSAASSEPTGFSRHFT